jgi:methylated-DNA-[protein]-cysteine S-methyltransferase
MDAIRHTTIDTPIGPLLAAADAGGALTGLWFDRAPAADSRRDDAPFAALREQLDAYFAGDLVDFDVTTAAAGTAWQRDVWSALAAVPYGDTLSYGELAQRLGRPSAARAVGAANGRNPLSIVVPCHRVIGASGALTGYAGGLSRKEWLLRHERATARARRTAPAAAA